MELILRNPNISQKISTLLVNFSKNCLSENGIMLYFKTLLNNLILWEISSNITSKNVSLNYNKQDYFLIVKFLVKFK